MPAIFFHVLYPTSSKELSCKGMPSMPCNGSKTNFYTLSIVVYLKAIFINVLSNNSYKTNTYVSIIL